MRYDMFAATVVLSHWCSHITFYCLSWGHCFYHCRRNVPSAQTCFSASSQLEVQIFRATVADRTERAWLSWSCKISYLCTSIGALWWATEIFCSRLEVFVFPARPLEIRFVWQRRKCSLAVRARPLRKCGLCPRHWSAIGASCVVHSCLVCACACLRWYLYNSEIGLLQ